MSNDSSLPAGFQAAGVACGVKPSGNLDLALLVSDRPCVAAGVFTQNRVVGAPVVVSRGRVPATEVRAVVVNSGNANACTGERGLQDARRMTEVVAREVGTASDNVLVCSTGVIGRFLPLDRIEQGISAAARSLNSGPAALRAAAQALMTTDTVEKVVTRRFVIDGTTVTMTGICKGAAMIAPNMATMLAVILTDLQLPADHASQVLKGAVQESFNNISVDGHMSTSDTVLLLANGASGAQCHSPESLARVQEALADVCGELAQKIIRDAEGAEHFVTVRVNGLPSESDARRIARVVCESALVKTAIAGNDPNWGRIVSAAGYAGVPFEEADLSLKLNGTMIYEAGRPLDCDAAALSASMKRGEVEIDLQFRLGTAGVRYWTCDLTAEYVRLNADYTT